jgi:hypothetical protein
MNCSQFEICVVELSGGQVTDAATQAGALAHAGECARCAARLAAERRMTARFAVLAENDAALRAPDRVRRALEAAFDEHFAPAAPPVIKPVAAPSWLNRFRTYLAAPFGISHLGWGLAAAALLLLAGAAVLGLLRDGAGRDDQAAVMPPPATASPRAAAPPPGEQPAQPEALKTSDGAADVKPAPAAVKADARPAKPALRRRVSVPARRAESDQEEVAELLHLTPLAATGPQEFEQVVRIEVPRSTLAMWGLPVNAERAAERVEAEVFIGEDGVARAIRLRQ